MQTLYIYSEPFKGSIKNTMHNGKVDYTGEQTERKYIDESGAKVTEISFINQLTFEQYNEQNGGNCKAVTEEELDKLFEEYEKKSILQKFTEITEERYFSLLECLPPKRWHKHNGLELFFMGECYTSNIYTCCIHDPSTKKYYSALRRITETSEEIETIYKESTNGAI